MYKQLMISIPLILATACTTPPRQPIVDTYRVSMPQFRTDMEECSNLAQQVDAGSEVLRQGLLGAAMGAAFGVITGSSEFAARGAGTGAVMGATNATDSIYEERSKVLRKCLRGRGYIVLN